MGVCLIWTEDEIPKWVTVTANCNQIFSEYDPVISQLTNAMVRLELNADKSARWHVFTWELLQAKVYKNTNLTSLKKPGFLSLTPKNGVIEPFNLWGRDCRKAANECGWSPSSGNFRHTSVNLAVLECFGPTPGESTRWFSRKHPRVMCIICRSFCPNMIWRMRTNIARNCPCPILDPSISISLCLLASKPIVFNMLVLPSGKHTKNYGKSPFSMGKSTISGHFQ